MTIDRLHIEKGCAQLSSAETLLPGAFLERWLVQADLGRGHL